MRRLWLVVVLGLFGASLQAQTPAQPVDPTQARPALPVQPDLPVPPTPATNSAPAPAPATIGLSVIADSSLHKVLPELAQAWADSQEGSPQVPLILTNAGTLRGKVESTGGFDVVITADLDDAKELGTKGLLAPDGQRTLARNTLLVYGRKALVKDDQLEWFDLIGTEWKKVAVGNADLTASGRVAKRALQKHDLLDEDHKNVFVYAGTEVLAIQVVEREEADAVFLYKTDLADLSLPGFEPLPLSSEDAPPIFYTAAITRLAKDPVMAKSFIDFIGGDAAREIWKKYGFETN